MSKKSRTTRSKKAISRKATVRKSAKKKVSARKKAPAPVLIRAKSVTFLADRPLIQRRMSEQVLASVPEAHHKNVLVKVANVNKKTGRCQFGFMRSNLELVDAVVCVVCVKDTPTGQFYVIPPDKCPVELLLRPGESPKWDIYGFKGDMADLYKNTIKKVIQQHQLTREAAMTKAVTEALAADAQKLPEQAAELVSEPAVPNPTVA